MPHIRLRYTITICRSPRFFILDHSHYSRWVPIHIRDMMTLHERHPDIATQFVQGGFVMRKTKHPFSAIAIEHAHKQKNKVVKGDGGANKNDRRASCGSRIHQTNDPCTCLHVGNFDWRAIDLQFPGELDNAQNMRQTLIREPYRAFSNPDRSGKKTRSLPGKRVELVSLSTTLRFSGDRHCLMHSKATAGLLTVFCWATCCETGY